MPSAVSNPFRPSFGVTPLIPAGRQATLAQVAMSLVEGAGSPYRFTLITGPRGSGKTVLLNMIEKQAADLGWYTARIPASSEMLTELNETILPGLLHQLDPGGTARTVTGASISHIGGIHTEKIDKYPQRQSLRLQLKTAAELAFREDKGILFSLDELQSATNKDLHQLSDSIQDCVRDELPVALSVAGLPSEVARLLDHPGTTFLRRAVPVDTNSLLDSEVAQVLAETAAIADTVFSPEALELAVREVQGYAFLSQLLGSVAFSLARTKPQDTSTITVDDLKGALPLIKERLGMQVHQTSLKTVPFREREVLEAMIETNATGEIAETMGIPANQLSTYLRRLRDRGLVYSVRRGQIDYALPYFREYLLAHRDTLL